MIGILDKESNGTLSIQCIIDWAKSENRNDISKLMEKFVKLTRQQHHNPTATQALNDLDGTSNYTLQPNFQPLQNAPPPSHIEDNGENIDDRKSQPSESEDSQILQSENSPSLPDVPVSEPASADDTIGQYRRKLENAMDGDGSSSPESDKTPDYIS